MWQEGQGSAESGSAKMATSMSLNTREGKWAEKDQRLAGICQCAAGTRSSTLLPSRHDISWHPSGHF